MSPHLKYVNIKYEVSCLLAAVAHIIRKNWIFGLNSIISLTFSLIRCTCVCGGGGGVGG